jgi:ubiquinone/menaquinone biosynthesis C-methylase UbiE
VELVLEVRRQLGEPAQAVHLECGAGLLTHLLAAKGVNVVGVDRRKNLLDLARQATGSCKYPKTAPRFELQTQPRRVPLEDGSCDMAIIADALERHANPVAVLREAYRLLADGKPVAIAARRKRGEDDASGPEHRYDWRTLANQVMACQFKLLTHEDSEPQGDVFVVAARGK